MGQFTLAGCTGLAHRGDTTYTLTQTQQSTVTAVEHSNMYTGVYTLTRDGSSDSSLHAKGWEGTAYCYTLDKTETGYEDSTTKGNRYLGFYILDGTYGSTSTAIETLVHGSYGSTFTEILTEDGTASGAGNNNSGDYARHDWGDRSADFEQYGTNADGDYHVTAGNVETFDRREIGNAGTGGYSLRETSDTDYSFTQVVDGSETWTLTGNDNDTMTAVEIGNRISSVYILNETGTDGYTLTETGTLSGGSFDQTVTGTDEYDTSWEGNHARASYERETVGGGTWTRTGTNADNGTNDYTLELSGDEIAGHFSASTSGTNRYDLVERFSDISNTEPGVTTPGNVSFHSHGLPFRDPVWGPPGGEGSGLHPAPPKDNYNPGMIQSGGTGGRYTPAAKEFYRRGLSSTCANLRVGRPEGSMELSDAHDTAPERPP